MTKVSHIKSLWNAAVVNINSLERDVLRQVEFRPRNIMEDRPNKILISADFSVIYDGWYATEGYWTSHRRTMLPLRMSAESGEFQTLGKKRKLRWFGHIARFCGLAKTILQGRVKGNRRIGRQKKRSEDNIKSGQWWTLLAQLQHLKTGLGGKGLLSPSVVHNDLASLWDRLDNMMVSSNMVTWIEVQIWLPFLFCIVI